MLRTLPFRFSAGYVPSPWIAVAGKTCQREFGADMANEERSGTSSKATNTARTGAAADAKPNGSARTAKPTAKAPAAPSSPTSAVPPRRSERREEMIKNRREERRTQYDRRKKEWLYTRIGFGAIAALIVLGLGWGVYTVFDNWRDEQDLDGVIDYDFAGLQHVDAGETVPYAEVPPAGGAHDARWQNCGFYSLPIRSEHAVHSLEHGAVWITYDPTLPQEQIDQLQEKADGEAYLLVSPFDGLPSPVVASSWNHQILLDGVDDDRLDTFIRVYVQGPDTPEPGASCSGQVSTTA